MFKICLGNLGNETIIQPAATLRDNAAVMTIVNILIGMVVGAAVVWFLITPAVSQNRSSTKNRSVISLSEQIASQKTQTDRSDSTIGIDHAFFPCQMCKFNRFLIKDLRLHRIYLIEGLW